MAHIYDLHVDWHHDGPKGAWIPPDTITIRHGMDDAETLCTIAHELAHFANDDPCGEDPVAEARAWDLAAKWLIQPESYAQAEAVYGHHPQAIAAELGVTVHLVETWRNMFERTSIL